jgi:integrase
LGTTDRKEADDRLWRLDIHVAVSLGLADKALLYDTDTNSPALDDGYRLYMEDRSAPEVAGGASKKTRKRYRAVFQKFLPWAAEFHISHWGQVDESALKAYGALLENTGYAVRTVHLELTTLVQTIKFLVGKGLLSERCRVHMSLRKPADSPTYCYSTADVDAILHVCNNDPHLQWLGHVCLALACTGLRISELSALRWSDVDIRKETILVANDASTAGPAEERRRTKSRKNRVVPVHPELLKLLQILPRKEDGRVFHGPRGGALRSDKVLRILTRDVLPRAAKSLRDLGVETEIEKGRLHSFRHFFCSECANHNVPGLNLMAWLGHKNSEMMQYYYHLSDAQSQSAMARLAEQQASAQAGSRRRRPKSA